LEEQSQDPSCAGSWNKIGKKGSAWEQLKRSNHEDSVGTNRGRSGGDASWSSSSSSWGNKRQKWRDDTDGETQWTDGLAPMALKKIKNNLGKFAQKQILVLRAF